MLIPYYRLWKHLPPEMFQHGMLDFAYRLGVPLAYHHERRGALFHKIWAHPDKTLEKSTLGSRVPLGLHTEMAFHSIKPSYILLYCLSNEGKVPTHMTRVDEVLEMMTMHEKRLLRQPEYMIFPPLSYEQDQSTGDTTPTWHSLYRDDNRLCIADHCHIEFKRERARHVYQKLIRICEDSKRSLVLEKGDLLIINNNTMIHGRDAFSDPNRILYRLYVY